MLSLSPGAPLLTPAQMRAAEAAAIAGGTSALRLMERAAAGAALAIDHFAPGRPALVLCGPGNNGGDGYGVAVMLAASGRNVRVAASGPARGEPAAAMAARWQGAVEPLATAQAAPLIIDALYGTGLDRALPEADQMILDRLRSSGATVVALDVPSGIDSRTGVALGAPLEASLTIAFGALKLGHALGAGRQLSGRVVVADIGIGLPEDVGRLVGAPKRLPLPADTHKFRRGSVLVVEGTPGRGGATGLTALAALRAGAGLVTLAGAGTDFPIQAMMRRSDAEALAVLADPRTGAVAIGPGLEDTQRSRDWLVRVLGGSVPVVVDAGALDLGFGPGSAAALFAESRAPLVLTPHEGEFNRLFGAVGPDRLGAVQAAAVCANAVVLLKGAETIIAGPDGRTAVNTRATPWLATAGSGDVLTGIIAALLAQGLAPFEAACAGSWLHGDAGVRGGPGLVADDLPSLLPAVLAAL